VAAGGDGGGGDADGERADGQDECEWAAHGDAPFVGVLARLAARASAAHKVAASSAAEPPMS
ncbi:MAG: hypothetical protein ACRDPC_27400, partial [Solirubrobacteraceae bacterium]